MPGPLDNACEIRVRNQWPDKLRMSLIPVSGFCNRRASHVLLLTCSLLISLSSRVGECFDTGEAAGQGIVTRVHAGHHHSILV